MQLFRHLSQLRSFCEGALRLGVGFLSYAVATTAKTEIREGPAGPEVSESKPYKEGERKQYGGTEVRRTVPSGKLASRQK